MDLLEKTWHHFMTVFQHYPWVTVCFLAVFAFLAIFRRRSMFKVFAILLTACALFYMVTMIGSGALTGKTQKETLVHKTQTSFEENASE